MRKSLCCNTLFVFALSHLCFAEKIKDLGTFGTVFTIHEKHIIEVLKGKIQSDEGKQFLRTIDEQIDTIREQGHVVPTPVGGITPSPENKSFLFDPSIALTQDLLDHQGVRFYKAGDQVNPLDFMTLSKRYVFIDGERKDQIAWAKRMQEAQNTVIILLKGDPLTVMRDQDMTVFFDQEGSMAHRFQLKHVPCMMCQEGKMLRISEWTEEALSEMTSCPERGKKP